MFEMVPYVLMVLTREGMMIVLFPDPLDFLLGARQFRDIVLLMAGLDAFVHQGLIHLVHIDNHGPAFSRGQRNRFNRSLQFSRG